MSTDPILVEGGTCWRRARADRVAFLIDGESYFSTVADAIESARESIFIMGWDLHTEVALRRDGRQPSTLAGVLRTALRRNPKLQVRILLWDYALIYLLERQPLPLLSFFWLSHRRIHVAHDSTAPPEASHHQKIVLIDDRLGFCGGIDLTVHRWDSTAHLADDPRRTDSGSTVYDPFHDVQVAVSGPVVDTLGRLVRERWRRATGKVVAMRPGPVDPWPEDLRVDLRDADAAIARTQPETEITAEVREVERLFIESIRVARRHIYIENQYLSACTIADALAESLRQPQGPEIVLVGPAAASGWLERSTMDVLRTRVLARLREADQHGRFRVYVPVVPGRAGDSIPVYVHAKVMVVDDALARVGSANLSNRSMGLDTECDLAIEARGRADVRAGILELRHRLLAEHLGTTAEAVRDGVEQSGSLIRAVEQLRKPGRTLSDHVELAPDWLLEAVPDRVVVDPERPLEFSRWVKEGIPGRLRAEAEVNLRLMGVLALVSSAAVALWTGSPAANRWTETLPEIGDSSSLLLLLAYLLATVLPLPTTLLTVVCVLGFGLLQGIALAGVGLGLNAALGYVIGRRVERDTVRRLVGRCLNRLSQRLARRGILAVTTLRLLPVTPFAAVGLVAGASRVRVGDYAVGTLLGVLPNLLLVGILVDRLAAVMRDPDLANVAVAVALFGASGAAALHVARKLNPSSSQHRHHGS